MVGFLAGKWNSSVVKNDGMSMVMRKKNVFITGLPGVGKTTLIEKVVLGLPIRAGGFVTREIRRKNMRVGFEVQTLSGERGVLAHRDFTSPFRVGRYGVDVSCFERLGITALQRAIRSSRLIVIDEIGKMELLCPGFRQTVLKALDSPKVVLATVQKGESGGVTRMKHRTDVALIGVTVENRDCLVKEVREWVLSMVNCQ